MKIYVLIFHSDIRECLKEGDHFVHILNPAFRIHKDDPRILEVKIHDSTLKT